MSVLQFWIVNDPTARFSFHVPQYTAELRWGMIGTIVFLKTRHKIKHLKGIIVVFKACTKYRRIFYVCLRNVITRITFDFKVPSYIFINNFTKNRRGIKLWQTTPIN